jgi:hypothetical protein
MRSLGHQRREFLHRFISLVLRVVLGYRLEDAGRHGRELL